MKLTKDIIELQMPIKYRIFGDATQAKYYEDEIWRDNNRIGFYVNGSQPINQWFGQNAFDYGQFGMIGHNGIDFSAMNGCCLYSMSDATVIWVKSVDDGYGENIETITDMGTIKLDTIYGHLQEQYVKEGDEVEAGDLIGLCDNTGYPLCSTGAHLHAGIRILYPMGEKPNMQQHWKISGWGYVRDGYLGYVDYKEALGEDKYIIQREINNVDKRYYKNYNLLKEITATSQFKKKIGRNPNKQETKAIAYGKWYPEDLTKTDQWLYVPYIAAYNSALYEH